VRKTGHGGPDDRTRRGHIVTSGPLPAHAMATVIDADVGRLIYRENRRMSAFE
jgi:hypothetical protein